MKKLAVIIILCMLLSGCGEKDSIAGVYTAKNSTDVIVLFQDGNCTYFGDTATWTQDADRVTVTKREPNRHFIEAVPDPDLPEDQQRSLTTRINMLEEVFSTGYEPGKIRVELTPDSQPEQVRQAISQIDGIADTQIITEPGPVTEYHFRVSGNCLTADNGTVYRKQGT